MRTITKLTAAAVASDDGAHVEVVALASDGTVWHLDIAAYEPEWKELPATPQGESKYRFATGAERDEANPAFRK